MTGSQPGNCCCPALHSKWSQMQEMRDLTDGLSIDKLFYALHHFTAYGHLAVETFFSQHP